MKVAHSCLTFCDPMDYTIHGFLQAKILEWVAFPFSRGSFQVDRTQGSHIVGGFFTIWARILGWVAYTFSSRSSRPRNPTRVSSLQAYSLTTELSGRLSRKPLPWLAINSHPMVENPFSNLLSTQLFNSNICLEVSKLTSTCMRTKVQCLCIVFMPLVL